MAEKINPRLFPELDLLFAAEMVTVSLHTSAPTRESVPVASVRQQVRWAPATDPHGLEVANENVIRIPFDLPSADDKNGPPPQ